jgi:hypothetical protein
MLEPSKFVIPKAQIEREITKEKTKVTKIID